MKKRKQPRRKRRGILSVLERFREGERTTPKNQPPDHQKRRGTHPQQTPPPSPTPPSHRQNPGPAHQTAIDRIRDLPTAKIRVLPSPRRFDDTNPALPNSLPVASRQFGGGLQAVEGRTARRKRTDATQEPDGDRHPNDRAPPEPRPAPAA